MEIASMISIETFDAIIWPFFAVAFVTTVLRLYTRLSIVRGFGLDDALIIVGQVGGFLSFFICYHSIIFSLTSETQLAAAGSNAMSHMQASALYDAYLLSLEAGRPLFKDTPVSVRKWDLVFRYAFISDCIYLLTLPSVLGFVTFVSERFAF